MRFRRAELQNARGVAVWRRVAFGPGHGDHSWPTGECEAGDGLLCGVGVFFLVDNKIVEWADYIKCS
jgi:hypothetical protein